MATNTRQQLAGCSCARVHTPPTSLAGGRPCPSNNNSNHACCLCPSAPHLPVCVCFHPGAGREAVSHQSRNHPGVQEVRCADAAPQHTSSLPQSHILTPLLVAVAVSFCVCLHFFHRLSRQWHPGEWWFAVVSAWFVNGQQSSLQLLFLQCLQMLASVHSCVGGRVRASLNCQHAVAVTPTPLQTKTRRQRPQSVSRRSQQVGVPDTATSAAVR